MRSHLLGSTCVGTFIQTRNGGRFAGIDVLRVFVVGDANVRAVKAQEVPHGPEVRSGAWSKPHACVRGICCVWIARSCRVFVRKVEGIEGRLSVLLDKGGISLHEARHGLLFFGHLPWRELANVGFCSLGFDVPEVPVIFQPSSFIGVGLDRRLPLNLLPAS